ncbi:MAG: zinc ribbon domain-containing protein, partial [Clostridia bacterium]|nr:zinc ribbon domain-containing protein [Clostridia bacterium]
MICSQCGKTLPDGSRFCDACGAPQAVETAPVAAPVAAVPETPAQPVYQQPAAPAQPVYQHPQQVYYAAPAPAPKAPNPM